MMMNNFTTIGKGHGAPCQPATQEDWLQARNNPQLAALCQQIEATTDLKEQKRLKEQLPVWTPRCAAFKDNHRAEQDALMPLKRQMFDIDEKGHTEEIALRAGLGVRGYGLEDKANSQQPTANSQLPLFIGSFEILLIEESVRRGTHVLVVTPEGMSLTEAQQCFSDLIGLPVDPAVKNVAGCIYMVPEDHVRYQSPKFFEPEVVQSASANSQQLIANSPHPTALPTDYDGIPYKTLVEALAEQLGGIPVHGSRNNFLFSMACHLRYVCNDDPQWIRQVLPTYGEDSERVFRTIQSACNRAQSRFQPAIVQRAISVARTQTLLSSSSSPSSSSSIYNSPTPPPMPKKLPKLIELLVSKVDPMYRPAVAQAVFAPLGAHLHGVRTRYIDNSESDLGGFMSICMAKQSVGKGSVNMPIELIMDDIRQRDDYSRELERQWKQQCKSAKANEKKPARPEGLCVQYLMSNMTNAALVQRLMDAQAAGDKFLYVKLDEIELLDQIKASGGATASEIIRLAFTQSLYGQERVSSESVTGTPPLRFCFNASTTIPSGQKYFRRGLTNGTLSRLTFSTIIKPREHRGIPRFGDYDEAFRQQLQPFITNLNAATGLIECKPAEQMAEKLAIENEDFSDLSDDETFETLSFRANRIIYDKAMLLYIADGYTWSKTIADFCKWSEQYDLWCKLNFFGSEMREATVMQQKPIALGPQNMLDLLPNRFTCQDLSVIHHAQGKAGDVMQLIYTWTHRGYIEQDSATQEYIKTKNYLQKHPSK